MNYYGAQICQTHFQQRSPDPSYNFVVAGMTGPGRWPWQPSQAQAPIPVDDVYAVDATLTQQNQTTTGDVHIGQVGDRLYWFTACR